MANKIESYPTKNKFPIKGNKDYLYVDDSTKHIYNWIGHYEDIANSCDNPIGLFESQFVNQFE